MPADANAVSNSKPVVYYYNAAVSTILRGFLNSFRLQLTVELANIIFRQLDVEFAAAGLNKNSTASIEIAYKSTIKHCQNRLHYINATVIKGVAFENYTADSNFRIKKNSFNYRAQKKSFEIEDNVVLYFSS